MLTGRHDKKSATMKTFFHELKNRRVYRVAITCVIAGSATVSSRRFRPGLGWGATENDDRFDARSRQAAGRSNALLST